MPVKLKDYAVHQSSGVIKPPSNRKVGILVMLLCLSPWLLTGECSLLSH